MPDFGSPLDEARARRLRAHLDRGAYARGLSREAERVVRRAFDEVGRRVASGAFDGIPLRERARLASITRQLGEMLADGYRGAEAVTARDLALYGAVEEAAEAGRLNDVARIVARANGVAAAAAPEVVTSGSLALLTRARAEAVAALPIEGRALGEWFEGQARGMSEKVRQQLQTGLLLGETRQDLARRILPSYADRDRDAPNVYRQARRDVQTIVRTATSAVQNDAAVRTYGASRGVVARVRVSATMDTRTSVLCAGLDGRVYALDDPGFRPPPYHLNCRTDLLPVVDFRALGLTPPPGAEKLLDPDPPGGYDRWLRAQPRAAQVFVLGAARADLYASGKVSLRDLVDSDRRVLTVRELAARFGVPGAASAAAA